MFLAEQPDDDLADGRVGLTGRVWAGVVGWLQGWLMDVGLILFSLLLFT